MALTNSIDQVKAFKVKREILGASAQTTHKILQLTILAKVEKQLSTKRKVKKFRHCSYEALIRIKGEVAKKCLTLRMIRRDRHPN